MRLIGSRSSDILNSSRIRQESGNVVGRTKVKGDQDKVDQTKIRNNSKLQQQTDKPGITSQYHSQPIRARVSAEVMPWKRARATLPRWYRTASAAAARDLIHTRHTGVQPAFTSRRTFPSRPSLDTVPSRGPRQSPSACQCFSTQVPRQPLFLPSQKSQPTLSWPSPLNKALLQETPPPRLFLLRVLALKEARVHLESCRHLHPRCSPPRQ